MDTMIVALGPAFAAGFGVQRLLELLDPVLSKIIPAGNKAIVMGLLSLAVGLLLSVTAGLRVLGPLGVPSSPAADAIDVILTGLIISAGTEGFNSILKFLGYAKEDKKQAVAAG